MIAVFLLLKLFAILTLAEHNRTSSNYLSSEPGLNLYYGEPVKIQDVPYFAGLHNCGAVIVSNIWVLTAAHCVSDPGMRGSMQVWVGGTTPEEAIKVPYNHVLIHPGYAANWCGAPMNDIALIKLNAPLQFSDKISPIRLPESNIVPPRNVVIVGKGQDETGQQSKRVKKLNLVQVSIEECFGDKLAKSGCTKEELATFKRNCICARKEANMPSICFGDSGSPLVSGKTLVGLASFIYSDSERDRYLQQCHDVRNGFYVNVASYVPWIKLNTGL